MGPGFAGVGVGHGRRDVDVGEPGREDPVVPVGRAAVEDLDDHLDVGGVEEPEVAGVGGEIDAAPVAGRAVAGPPVRRHAEAAVVEAEGRLVGQALGCRRSVRGEPNDLGSGVVGDPDRPVGGSGDG